MNSSLFLYLGAFLSGVVGGSFWSGAYAWWWPWVSLLISLGWRHQIAWRSFFLALALFCFGFGRSLEAETQLVDPVARFDRTEIWSFWVCTDPEPAWDKQIAVLCPTSASSTEDVADARVIVNLPLYPRVYYGDNLSLKCRLAAPPVFNDFNYAAYLAAHGINGICYWPEIISVTTGVSGSASYRGLFTFKRRALLAINAYLPEPESGLAAALLLGYKKTLHSLEEIDFQKAGLSHLVAISGGHISLFLNLLISLFIYLGMNKRWAIWPALALAGVYVVLTGLQAAAWRSLLMGALMLYAWRRGRLSGVWPSLLLAAAVMLWRNPALWQRDLGFQLSFLALSGMITFSPILNRISEPFTNSRWRRRYWRPLINAFNLSLSAQLTVWPLLALKSGGISFIAPLANVFAFWVFGPLMLSLLVALGLSIWFGALILWVPAYLLLRYLLLLARYCAILPGAYLEVSNFKPIYAIFYYFSLLIFLFFYYRRRQISCRRFQPTKKHP